MTILSEIKEQLETYKKPIHRGNPTAQKYVGAVEFLLATLEESEERRKNAEMQLEIFESQRYAE